MKLRTAALLIALGILLAPLAADAQPPARVARIGILWLNPLSATGHLLEAFRQGLRELGYVEGQNIAIEFRSAEGKLERLPDVAAELVRLKVDVIMTGTIPLIRAAQRATTTIPIVMGNSGGDPVRDGFVASLARPGGNITGLSLMAPELAGKRLQLLKEVVPKVSRVAVLWDPNGPGLGRNPFRDLEVAAQALGVELQSLEVRADDELEQAFQAATRGRAGAVMALTVLLIFRNRTRLVELAAKSRLPAMWGSREFVNAGGLMAYGTSIPDLYRRAAAYVEKILKGAKPADLPVEQPMRFEFVVNLKTAKALGLTIPQSILMRADQVIE
ncbi:MAG: ABC transporter substrate-binding protein [Candidatus Rokubacteria bacterium]|nr:ABC transporter substrate-binding protein [Candidatus Rokubacteria bacterium]